MGKLSGVLWEEREKKMNRREEKGRRRRQLRLRVCGLRICETRENNSTLPKLAKIGLGRKRVTDWRGVWPGSLLSFLLPAVLSPGRFLALSPRWAAWEVGRHHGPGNHLAGGVATSTPSTDETRGITPDE